MEKCWKAKRRTEAWVINKKPEEGQVQGGWVSLGPSIRYQKERQFLCQYRHKRDQFWLRIHPNMERRWYSVHQGLEQRILLAMFQNISTGHWQLWIQTRCKGKYNLWIFKSINFISKYRAFAKENALTVIIKPTLTTVPFAIIHSLRKKVRSLWELGIVLKDVLIWTQEYNKCKK